MFDPSIAKQGQMIQYLSASLFEPEKNASYALASKNTKCPHTDGLLYHCMSSVIKKLYVYLINKGADQQCFHITMHADKHL